jgi:hypothetical protein
MVREPMLACVHHGQQRGAYPKLLERLDRFGVNEGDRARVAARLFVQPRWLDGLSGIRGVVHCASLWHRDTIGQQITLLLVMMLSSKGIAGVPRASLVVVAAVLPTFGPARGGPAGLWASTSSTWGAPRRT